jgi:hypothetical protein
VSGSAPYSNPTQPNRKGPPEPEEAAIVKTGLQTLELIILLAFFTQGAAQEIPVPDPGKEPVFATEGGLGIGLWPLKGPKGLIRIYAPSLGVEPPDMINFIAVEPVVDWQKGLSEIEELDFKIVHSRRTDRGLEYRMATGLYKNGADLEIEIRLDRDTPDEIHFQVFTTDSGKPPFAVILTATMGNYSGLREIWLANGPVHARHMWVAPIPKDSRFGGFAPHREFYPPTLHKAGGWVIAAATPDATGAPVANPEAARHWHYMGRTATQYWKARPIEKLRLRVNARATYWGSNADIHGGPAIENFEFAAPFRQGQEFIFGVTEKTPIELGFKGRANPAIGKDQRQ